jgi:hypothetical protein
MQLVIIIIILFLKKNTKNILIGIAPKPSNITKTIDVQAWDKLFTKYKQEF